MERAETPRQTAQREVREELGLEVEVGRLSCVDFVPTTPTRLRPGVMYLFDGGRVDAAEQAGIRLPDDELADRRFVSREQLPDYMRGLLLRRVRAGLAARDEGMTVDLANGFQAPPAQP